MVEGGAKGGAKGALVNVEKGKLVPLAQPKSLG